MLGIGLSLPGSVGLGSPVRYLGPVATRAYANDAVFASTTGWNARTAHYARDAISSLQILLCNWYVNAGVGETGQGGAQTVTASIEYPVGTFTQIKFGGNASYAIPDLASIVSDAAVVSIPKGALFFIRVYRVNAVSIIFSSRHINLTLGDAVNNTNADQTMSGTVTDNGNGSLVPVQGIVGTTALPSIGVIGSSRMVGYTDFTYDSTGETGYARMFGGSFAYMDFSVSGDKTLSVAGSGGSKRRALLAQYCSRLWLDPGLNDISNGVTAASVMTSLSGMASAWPGGLSKVIMNDEAAYTTSTDGWTTTANQTVSGFEAQRVALNTSINALTGYNQIVQTNTFDGNGTNSQFWNNPVVGGSQFTPDGIHENTAACIALKNSGRFNAALVR